MLALSHAPSDIQEGAMHMVERFVILMYDRTSTSTEIDKARRKLFAKKADIKQIPPTKAAFEQHMMRAVFQGGHIWGPTSWGWTKTEDGLYEPIWTTLPEAAQACYELVSCKCKKGCVKCCRCKKAGLECTDLCICERECSHKCI